ncbi:hypothetical protein UUU_07130 [Klebsiella pneumoniae subsp. pneumoniae DSM 30104 = JCM 1662 = NBRC 14940]|nr:hypothetical protein UUU_07130 [Klebsiella pneumoniae subsp. pneumoniae DSM 30104 = JCM 1662 = NBRC 14940]
MISINTSGHHFSKRNDNILVVVDDAGRTHDIDLHQKSGVRNSSCLSRQSTQYVTQRKNNQTSYRYHSH